jgi:hypothetical protein
MPSSPEHAGDNASTVSSSAGESESIAHALMPGNRGIMRQSFELLSPDSNTSVFIEPHWIMHHTVDKDLRTLEILLEEKQEIYLAVH